MRRLETALLLTTLAVAPATRAQEPDSGDARVTHHREYLVSTEWLASHLDAPDVVVVQVGHSDDAYRAGHIRGARFLPLSAVATTVAGLSNEFPPPAQLAATFRDLGVGNDARIVLYADDAGLLAARAWVALDLLGHARQAALLDGGLSKWVAERRALETAPPRWAPRPFAVRWRTSGVVDATWVRRHLGSRSVVFVDARPPDQYAGAEPPCPPAHPACGQIPPERRGHLPGARSLYWMAALVSRADPVLRPMHALHEDLWKATGADRPQTRTVVTYCVTGLQASYDYFMARYVGYPDVRLYDGSFADWAARQPASDYPVEHAP